MRISVTSVCYSLNSLNSTTAKSSSGCHSPEKLSKLNLSFSVGLIVILHAMQMNTTFSIVVNIIKFRTSHFSQSNPTN